MHDGPRVKICGLCRRQDALTADALGVDYLGVVLTPGFGRSVTVAEGSSILEGVGATRVAVVVDESADRVAAVARALPAKVIQLHGSEAPEWVRELRAHGEWTIWKALRARAPEDVARTLDVFGTLIDGLLLEGWKEEVVGGGGARLDPDTFSAARDLIPEPLDLILAGGLTPGSVGSAVARFQPDVVDVSSGVEARPREKDPDRLRRFVQNARGAAGVSRRSSREPRGEGPS
ncbi:MAG: phosphoribosylanthranilate isomerase [Gemmatimonadota bacterium]